MEGLQVEGGHYGWLDSAWASQRSQGEAEGEARAAAGASMLLLSPALTNQLLVAVMLQIHPGNS